MATRTNRRDFLKTSAVAGAGLWLAGRQARAQSGSAKDKLNIANIAVGGMGSGDTFDCREHNIVALCDVDENAINSMLKRLEEDATKNNRPFVKPKTFVDFRKMFDEMEKSIDAVTVSTPDHTHAIAAMWAMQRGKHTFVQKPLAHDVAEARMLTEAAKKYNVCTQMGNQGTSEDGLREAVEVIWSGAIGKVKEVHVWTNRPIWPQGTGALLRIPSIKSALHGGKSESIAVPSHLHWDLWLGTAPVRQYYPEVYHNFRWRGWWDFGTGALGDMACHTANMAFKACKLGYPTSVEAEVSEYNPESFPMWSVIRYEFPAREDLPPLKWTWYDGGGDKPAWVNKKLKELAHGMDIPGSGSLIIGEKGTLFSPNDYGAKYQLLPEADFAGYKPPTPTLPRAHNQHKPEWFKAIREGKPEIAMSNFSYAGPLTETVVLGCVAMRFAGRKLEWDGPNMKVTNIAEANQYLKRDYRKGWTL